MKAAFKSLCPEIRYQDVVRRQASLGFFITNIEYQEAIVIKYPFGFSNCHFPMHHRTL